jgi:hypothetical protein
MRRVNRYLKYAQRLAICYGQETACLHGYLDADFAVDPQDRKSIIEYAFLLGGATVTWASQKQQLISTSTTEAEYVGLCNAGKEAVWIQNLL